MKVCVTNKEIACQVDQPQCHDVRTGMTLSREPRQMRILARYIANAYVEVCDWEPVQISGSFWPTPRSVPTDITSITSNAWYPLPFILCQTRWQYRQEGHGVFSCIGSCLHERHRTGVVCSAGQPFPSLFHSSGRDVGWLAKFCKPPSPS